MLRLFFLLSLALAGTASAQDALQRVILDDGTVIVGEVVDPEADPVVVIGANGIEQRIPRARIAEITDLLEGRFTRYDPARTRMFFSPTARSLGAGERRFSAYYLFPSYALGLGDRVDLSLGATIPLISSEGIYFGLNANGKVTVAQGDGFAAAVGGSVALPVSTEDSLPGLGGTLYVLTTFGGEASAVTVGAYGLYTVDFNDGNNSELADGTALLLGLERQISDRFKLISENYAVLAFSEECTRFDNQTFRCTEFGTATDVLFGTLNGVRFFGDRLAADIAVALGAYEGDFSTIPIPYLGMSYTF